MHVWLFRKDPLASDRPRKLRLTRRPLLALTALAVAGVIAAGCGSSNNSGSGSSSGGGSSGGGGGAYGASPTPSTSGGQSGAATVATASTKLGSILVDGTGRTLYLFAKDTPNQSNCSGACVAAWPVDHSSGAPKAGSGVKASMLGTITRSDGTTQVTYNRHPLYYYSGDTGAGQQNGQGINAFGAVWHVVNPTGAAVV